jgi:hypothetical protein
MVAYVFGAGASLHAGYPLTANLGNDIHYWAQSDSMLRGDIDELHELYGGLADLEKILTELYGHPVGSKAATLSQSRRGAIIGAIQVAIPELFNLVRQKPIDGPDFYRELARLKITGDDSILTFNYDLGCERALRAEGLWEIGDGYGFSLGADITPPSKVKVLKLHGSVNWLGMLFGGITGFSQCSNVYGPRPCLFGERDFTFLGYPKEVRDPLCKGISTTGGEPALILPGLPKKFFHQTHFGQEWEPFWDRIWAQAQQALASAKRIVIIGYSMPTADERARELLLKYSNHGADIQVFSGSRTCAICKDFRNSGFRSVNSLGNNYFEDYLRA